MWHIDLHLFPPVTYRQALAAGSPGPSYIRCICSWILVEFLCHAGYNCSMLLISTSTTTTMEFFQPKPFCVIWNMCFLVPYAGILQISESRSWTYWYTYLNYHLVYLQPRLRVLVRMRYSAFDPVLCAMHLGIMNWWWEYFEFLSPTWGTWMEFLTSGQHASV